MSPLDADLRHAARRLARSRGFFLTVALMFGLGIGATTAIFSLINGILLRPLPFRDPGRLVQLGEHVGNNSGIGITTRDIRAYETQTSAFSSMGAVGGASFVLSGKDRPEQITAARLTSGVFPTLGVQPVLGRVFTRQEDEGHAQVTVLSDALWTTRYHRDPHIIGQAIELDGKPYTILGVMPRGFEFPLTVARIDQVQLWVPMSLMPDELSDEAAGVWGFQMVARLRDGVTIPQAAQDAARVARQIMRSYPPALSRIHITGDVEPLGQTLTGDTRPLLRIWSIAVAVVLLIACANVAILLLVRAVEDHRQHAIRLALGARSGAIFRASLLEGLLLSLSGAVLGLGFAALIVRIAAYSLSGSIPRVESVSIDTSAALFALCVALLTGVVCSLVPFFVATRTNLVESLKSGSITATRGSGHARLRSAIVVTEVAIAVVLLTAAVALLRSYQKMLAVDPGFEPQHVLVADYRLPQEQYPTPASVTDFNHALIERLSALPGIRAAGLGNSLPSSGNSGMAGYTIEGQAAAGWKLQFAVFGTIYGNYFQALGIPLLAGRTFTDADRADAPLVIVVNQSMARHSWPGQNPIGKRMHVGNPNRTYPWATVVGVVGNTRLGGRDEKIVDAWYAPAEQPAILYGSAPPQRNNTLAEGDVIVRAAIPPDQLAGTLRNTVAGLDPQLALNHLRTMTDVLSVTEAPRRIMTQWIAALAATALLLALAGIYAVISFSVTLRVQEIATRMALGASRQSVASLILRSGATLVLLGAIIGLAASLAVSRFISSFLFGVGATDPWIYLASFVLMLAVACLASALPALRAASTDPNRALRAG